jgi:formylglycine-generating enzyme
MSILRRFPWLGFVALVAPLPSCGANDAKPDAGDTDADSGADSDTGTEPVDPEIDWVEIPAGSFTFGSPEGTPCIGPLVEKEVPVTLTRPFLMAKHEITQRQWKALGFALPQIGNYCENCPVHYIDWFEALAWCNALSRFEGIEECYDLSSCTGEIGNACWPGEEGCPDWPETYQCSGKTRRCDSMYDCTGYRLPTGPEWEYAAKAGTTTTTYNGDVTTTNDIGCVEEPVLNDIAWYCANSGCWNDCGTIESSGFLKEVGQKQPNPFGLYDMLGNASEWVDYIYTGLSLDSNEGELDESLVDPMGTTEDDDSRRDNRGGAYSRAGCHCRAGSQVGDGGELRGPGYGFRPVRTVQD